MQQNPRLTLGQLSSHGPNWQFYQLPLLTTRHRESTSMYSLTFRVRVTTTPQYGRNGTAHAAGTSMLSPARGVFAGMHVCVCGMREACGGPGGLPLGSDMHFHSVAIATQLVHRLQIRPIVHNYGGIPYHSPRLHPGPCNRVGMQLRTDTQTVGLGR